MKLTDLKNQHKLVRPNIGDNMISDGTYSGTLITAELTEKESKFSPDGVRVVLNLKVEIYDEAGNPVHLYLAPNYNWSERGNMIKILEKLDALPEPGEGLELQTLVGLPVSAIVENVEKDGRTFSNIVSLRRAKITAREAKKQAIDRQPRLEEVEEYDLD